MFGQFSNQIHYKPQDIPTFSPDNNIVIITGASSGIGLQTAALLAAKGAHLYLLGRDANKMLPIITKLKQDANNQNISFVLCDQLNLQSTSNAANTLTKEIQDRPIHSIYCNAGIMHTPYQLSFDKIEAQIATNHLSHYLLVRKLLPLLLKNNRNNNKEHPARIVMVSSLLHKHCKQLDIDATLTDPGPRNYDTGKRYAASKLANVLFANTLARQLASDPLASHIYVNSVHPGVVKTDLMRDYNPLLRFVIANTVCIDVDKGCLTQVYCGTSPDIVGKQLKGKYFVPFGKEEAPSKLALDVALGDQLWKWSEELIVSKIGNVF